MVCHTAVSASPPDPENDCSAPRRSDPQPSAAAFAGAVAAVGLGLGVGTTVVHASSKRQQDNFMDVDTASPTPALSTSTVTSAESADPAPDASDVADSPAPHLVFRSGVVSIPHPEKADKGGEDAYFVQTNALGVFDGVGGWASIGVDAGLYSKELARLTASYICREGPSAVVDALKNATENNRAIGSSTACVVGLKGEKLIGVNLGDSGLIVIRDGAIVYQTREQQHYFNCPYQIGTDSLDTVDVGGPIEVTLQHGDCIIMGTDGLWDNIFHNNILEIVLTHHPQTKSKLEDEQKTSNDNSSDGGSVLSDCSTTANCNDDAQLIAQRLADAAVKVANDERSSSPFAVNAQNAGHLFLGGKVDDITIISTFVIDPNLNNTAPKSPAKAKDEHTSISD